MNYYLILIFIMPYYLYLVDFMLFFLLLVISAFELLLYHYF